MSSSVVQDLRYAARQLARSRAYTLVAVLSLAVGIGATTTVFSVANGLLLRPRPGIDERGLVDVGRTDDGAGFDNFSYPNFLDYREGSRNVLVDLAAYSMEPDPVGFAGSGDTVRIYSQPVSGNFFDLLGVRPQAGRFFLPGEDQVPQRNLVVVASDRFWRDHLDGAREAIGRELLLNGRAFTLVGIAPAGFQGPVAIAPDVWMPIHAAAEQRLLDSRASVWLIGIGRLRPGMTLARANAALRVMAARIREAHPVENRGQGLTALPSSRFPAMLGTAVSRFLSLLLAFVLLVLVVACVNLAGLMLARATARRREIGIRLALGAARGRIVRQLVTEALLVFAVGGAAGVLFAVWWRGLLVALIPALPVPVLFDLPLDVRVLGFALALTLAAGLLTALVPALQATRPGLVHAIRDGMSPGRPSSLRGRNALVIAQVALSMLLVVAAGLMARAMEQAARIDPGFDPEHVEVAALDLTLAGLDEAGSRAFASDLLARVTALSGVDSASLAVDLLLDGSGFGLGGVRAAGDPQGRDIDPDWNIVTPAYHDTLRIHLAAGRWFDGRDREGALPVAIVNETLARRLWPGQSAVGQRLISGEPSDPVALEVVGVERDLKYRSLGEAPRPFVYVPLAQRWTPRFSLVVRRDPGRSSVIPDVRAIVRALDPRLPIVEARPLASYVAIGLLPQRVAFAVAASLGGVGLFLAAIGIYGVTAYSVARRTREIGIRMALGAGRGAVVRLVLGQGIRLAAIGIALGGALALAGGQAVRSLLYGIGPADPLTYAGAGLLFALVAIAASGGPTRRAVRVDPAAALRNE
jgi:predicted permease